MTTKTLGQVLEKAFGDNSYITDVGSWESYRVTDWDKAAQAVVDAYVAGQWMPISTAPKDGTVVLVYCKNSLRRIPMTGGYWESDAACKCWIAGGYMQKSSPPTHWMPLPLPPVAEVKP